MEDYIGKICPFCRNEIQEGDNVITCSVCGIAHHAACWEQNCGCTTFGCSQQNVIAPAAEPAPAPVEDAQPVYEQPAAPVEYAQPAYAQPAYAQPAASAEICTACGTPFNPGQAFCSRCGTPKPAAAPAPRTCRQCGTVLQGGQMFCSICGAQAEAPAYNPAISQYNAQVEQKKSPKKLLIIAAAVVAVIVLILLIMPKDTINDMLPATVLSVEDLCAKGDYQAAYDKATGSEKDKVLGENAIAYVSQMASEVLKDPNSFSLRKGYYYPFINSEGKLGGYAVIYSSGTNSYGNTVSDYMAYTWSSSEQKWNYWGSCTTYVTSSSDDWEDTLVKIIVEAAIEKGTEISRDSVNNINTLFEEGKLDEVELIDYSTVDTSRFPNA